MRDDAFLKTNKLFTFTANILLHKNYIRTNYLEEIYDSLLRFVCSAGALPLINWQMFYFGWVIFQAFERRYAGVVGFLYKFYKQTSFLTGGKTAPSNAKYYTFLIGFNKSVACDSSYRVFESFKAQ